MADTRVGKTQDPVTPAQVDGKVEPMFAAPIASAAEDELSFAAGSMFLKGLRRTIDLDLRLLSPFLNPHDRTELIIAKALRLMEQPDASAQVRAEALGLVEHAISRMEKMDLNEVAVDIRRELRIVRPADLHFLRAELSSDSNAYVIFEAGEVLREEIQQTKDLLERKISEKRLERDIDGLDAWRNEMMEIVGKIELDAKRLEHLFNREIAFLENAGSYLTGIERYRSLISFLEDPKTPLIRFDLQKRLMEGYLSFVERAQEAMSSFPTRMAAEAIMDMGDFYRREKVPFKSVGWYERATVYNVGGEWSVEAVKRLAEELVHDLAPDLETVCSILQRTADVVLADHKRIASEVLSSAAEVLARSRTFATEAMDTELVTSLFRKAVEYVPANSAAWGRLANHLEKKIYDSSAKSGGEMVRSKGVLIGTLPELMKDYAEAFAKSGSDNVKPFMRVIQEATKRPVDLGMYALAGEISGSAAKGLERAGYAGTELIEQAYFSSGEFFSMAGSHDALKSASDAFLNAMKTGVFGVFAPEVRPEGDRRAARSWLVEMSKGRDSVAFHAAKSYLVVTARRLAEISNPFDRREIERSRRTVQQQLNAVSGNEPVMIAFQVGGEQGVLLTAFESQVFGQLQAFGDERFTSTRISLSEKVRIVRAIVRGLEDKNAKEVSPVLDVTLKRFRALMEPATIEAGRNELRGYEILDREVPRTEHEKRAREELKFEARRGPHIVP